MNIASLSMLNLIKTKIVAKSFQSLIIKQLNCWKTLLLEHESGVLNIKEEKLATSCWR